MRAIAIKTAGSWSDKPADCVVLDYDDRRRRRLAMQGTRGLSFLLDLPGSPALKGGDALVLEDGRLIEVLAAPEQLMELRCDGPLHLTRLAWHIGNRHVPAQILDKAIRLHRDHVIAEMAERLGAKVRNIDGPFEPEGGAYAPSEAGAHAGHAHGGDRYHHHEHHGHTHHTHPDPDGPDHVR
jgi:urease accessory protein